MRRETDGNRYASGDCEGPGSATQSSWTREDETPWADTSLPEIPRGQSRGGGSFIPRLNLGSSCSNMLRESWVREGKKPSFRHNHMRVLLGLRWPVPGVGGAADLLLGPGWAGMGLGTGPISTGHISLPGPSHHGFQLPPSYQLRGGLGEVHSSV